MIIIYVELADVDLVKIKNRFMKSLKNAERTEVADIVCIEKKVLLKMVNNQGYNKLYTKVQQHLKYSEDFISSL